MSQNYCTRCYKKIGGEYKYVLYCIDCVTRVYGNVPDHIPDTQVRKWLTSKEKKCLIVTGVI